MKVANRFFLVCLTFCFLLLSFFATDSKALVDYTENSFRPRARPANRPKFKRPKINQVAKTMQKRRASNGKNSNSIDVGAGIQSVDVAVNSLENKATFYKFSTYLQTNYNIYLDASYWYASADGEGITNTSKTYSGNPLVKVGFNWLKLGNSADMTLINFFGGALVKGTRKSPFASSRTDKIVGIETSKRFNRFVIALGYQLSFTGVPDLENEVDIGDIHTLKALLGWQATQDISFVVEGNLYKIKAASNVEEGSILDENVSLGYVSPKLMLSLSRYFDLELGGLFRTRKVNIDEQMVDARLWNYEGIYGNSIFAKGHIVF